MSVTTERVPCLTLAVQSKSKVFRTVKSFKVETTSPQCFENYGDKVNRNSIGLYSYGWNEEPTYEESADVANTPAIDGTIRIQMVKRVYNEDGICKL